MYMYGLKYMNTHIYIYIYLFIYSRIPLIRINWDGEPSGYVENSDNWIFL